jgi:GTP cyclohydrolase II
MISKIASGDLKTKFGIFQEALYYDGQSETVVMFMGDLHGAEDVLCRIHSSCIFGHYFNSIECSCQEEMDLSQQLIQQEGKGIIILLNQEGKGNGHYALLNSVKFKRQGLDQSAAYKAAGFKEDARDYSTAAKILKDMKLSSVRMLTNNASKVEILEQNGIKVSGTKALAT